MCNFKEGSCSCGCDDNALDEIRTYTTADMAKISERVKKLEKKLEKEKEEDIVEINGVEYVRRNKKELIEEPVIVEDDGKELLTE